MPSVGSGGENSSMTSLNIDLVTLNLIKIFILRFLYFFCLTDNEEHFAQFAAFINF